MSVVELSIAMSSYPEVHARQWLHTSGVTVRLLSTYSLFHFAVVGALAVSDTARLYWFPHEHSSIDDRRPITDDASLVLFKEAWSGGLRPIVWAYTPISGSAPPSPEDMPPFVFTPAPVTPVTKRSSIGRDSGQQKEFRATVLARDGKDVCVACARAGPTEAAHILGHGSPSSLLVPAGLLSAWDVRNGIMLCSVCHLYFDKYMWCVVEGVVIVAGALLADEELSPHFAPLVGRVLRHEPGSHWPCEPTWAHHRQLFEAARNSRHAMQAGNSFMCDDCGAMFKRHGGWEHHVTSKTACAKRIRGGKRKLWTPLDRVAFPDAVAQEAELGAAARRLSLVDEEEGVAGSPGEEDESDGSVFS